MLRTPPLARLVPDGVFDGFSWCESDHLEWRRPSSRWELEAAVDGADPARMVFVFHDATSIDFLPQELAKLHAYDLGLQHEQALAPYAIDDATDELCARRLRPRDVLWLAADNLNALYWGLHDWAHFHNHGPFEQRAFNELQCDTAALAWMTRNRVAIGLADARRRRLVEEVMALSAKRFEAEGIAWNVERDRALAAIG